MLYASSVNDIVAVSIGVRYESSGVGKKLVSHCRLPRVHPRASSTKAVFFFLKPDFVFARCISEGNLGCFLMNRRGKNLRCLYTPTAQCRSPLVAAKQEPGYLYASRSCGQTFSGAWSSTLTRVVAMGVHPGPSWLLYHRATRGKYGDR